MPARVKSAPCHYIAYLGSTFLFLPADRSSPFLDQSFLFLRFLFLWFYIGSFFSRGFFRLLHLLLLRSGGFTVKILRQLVKPEKISMLSKLVHIFGNFLTFSFSFFRSMDTYVTNKTILLVDDDADFCDLIAPLLQRQGFKVLSAYTLESAKDQLIAYSPSIILLDHLMPDGLGAEFLVTNKTQLENKNVIFITADPSPDLKDKVKELGVFDFLPKPFHPSALNKIIYLAATFN